MRILGVWQMEYFFLLSEGTKAQFNDDSFVHEYAPSYFRCMPRAVPGIRQSRCSVEKWIQGILVNGFTSGEDVLAAMAWKAGKILQSGRNSADRIDYSADWKKHAVLLQKTDAEPASSKEMLGSIAEFAAWVYRKSDSWSSQVQNDPQSILNEMGKNAPKGIGTTQMISLLCFLSRGDLPIMDRYAVAAARSIREGILPGSEYSRSAIWKELPLKTEGGFSRVFEERISPYKEDLCVLFGNRWILDRDVDRALWVYGHRLVKGGRGC